MGSHKHVSALDDLYYRSKLGDPAYYNKYSGTGYYSKLQSNGLPKKVSRSSMKTAGLSSHVKEQIEFEKEKEGKVATGSELIRPEDITDAIDGRDLLATLVATNVGKVEEKVDLRKRKEWLEEETKRRRAQYYELAKEGYEKIWTVCSKSAVGHNGRNVDRGGYTVKQCDDCKFVFPPSKQGSSYYSQEKRSADEMNRTLIKSMVERMIELDIEAGIFTWPTIDDYPRSIPSMLGDKKKGWFK